MLNDAIPWQPWGTYSGVSGTAAIRTPGLVTVEHYTQLKTVYTELGDVESPWPDRDR